MDYISVTAELERLKIDFYPASEAEIKVLCQFHPDSTPSCYINTEKKVCHCKSCSWEGDFVSFLAKAENKLRAEVDWELKKRYGIVTTKSINPQRVEAAHKNIWVHTELMLELEKRGVGPKEIKQHRLGYDRKRITIPIYDEDGFVVNIRKYIPGAPSDKKFRDEKGCGKNLCLYPISQTSFDSIVICSGEIKAISAATRLNQHGIGAISATGGEHRWASELTDSFIGKKVWIAYDIDEAGVAAAFNLARQMAAYTKWLGIIKLPISAVDYPKGGIDDFKGDLLKVLGETEEYVLPKSPEEKIEEIEPIFFESLDTVVHADNMGVRIQADCVVSSKDTMPYAVPKRVQVTCPKSIEWCKICSMQPLKTEDMIRTVPPEHDSILSMLDTTKEALKETLKETLGIPRLCGVCSFETLEFQHAEDTRISENLDVAKRATDKSMIPAVILAEHVVMNEPYTFTGRLVPHPVTNQSTLLVSGVEKKIDDLSSFRLEDKDELSVFRPAEWTEAGVSAKLNEIYDDLEANITKIFKRRQMHLMVDLAYHSPLFLTFRGKNIKGWVEVLIVGDSSQGKTETAINLQNHYGLGSWLSCKGASTAGIIGGLQQSGKKWFVTWGAMPTQDRRLLVLEELKGLEPEMIAKLTDARSSGMAEIVKIEKRKTFARVRLVALSNPRSDRAVATYNSGVDVIHELIPSLEDIRRFDGFYVINKNDININDVIGTEEHIHHIYDTDRCRRLILWAWTVQKVTFEDENHLLDMSIKFGNQYSDDIPIYDRGSGRYKIARLAAALACRTFSCGEQNELVVRKCHVEYICSFLEKIYSSDTFGYLEYSRRQKVIETIVDEDAVIAAINKTPHPRSIADVLLNANRVDTATLGNVSGYGTEEAKAFFSFLLRSHCVRQKGLSYFKTASFLKLLKECLDNNQFQDVPSYFEPEALGM